MILPSFYYIKGQSKLKNLKNKKEKQKFPLILSLFHLNINDKYKRGACRKI